MGPSRHEKPSKPSIRVKSGCLTCRRRKKKCDEKKPVCSGCARNGLVCQWPEPPSLHVGASKVSKALRPRQQSDVSILSISESDQGIRRVQSCSSPTFDQGEDAIFTSDFQIINSLGSDRSSSESAALNAALSPAESNLEEHREENTTQDSPLKNCNDYDDGDSSPHQVLDMIEADIVMINPHEDYGTNSHQKSNELSTTLTRFPLHQNLSNLPHFDSGSFELLSYYLTRTSVSMGNGSTETNPFVAQLIPFAFMEPLLLQLLLAQSAAHRAVVDQSITDTVAQRHYNTSLRLFRSNVNEYLEGSKEKGLALVVGSLTMCLTEVAKGDVHGVIFRHLDAAKALLVEVLSSQKLSIPKGLRDFLIEYYTYTATLSMISIDPTDHKLPIIDTAILQAAHELVYDMYVGHLCGCWLPLLVLIPDIIELKAKSSANTAEPMLQSADDAMMLVFLQNQILHYSPMPNLGVDVSLAGRVFQHAVMLYLLTMFGSPHQGENGMHSVFVENTITQALYYLEQIPATARINTSLLWPLAVVGSCVSDQEVQAALRKRLQVMLETIGLGNIRETLNLLEHIWEEDIVERGPWNIWKTMQTYRIWISFA